MTIGAAAEDAVLRNAEKLKLTSMKEKAIAGLLAQQAADTAVNTPITIAAGLAAGKNRKEISKDIGKQMLTDAAVNVGFAGIDIESKRAKQNQAALQNLMRTAQKDILTSRQNRITTNTKNVLEYYGITDIHKPSEVVRGVLGKIRNTFLSTNGNIRPIVNNESGYFIEIWKKGIEETFHKDKVYSHLSAEMKTAKIASVEYLPELIRTGRVSADNISSYHSKEVNTKYLYLENEIKIDNKEYSVAIDIKKLPDGSNRFHVHNIRIKEATGSPQGFSRSGPPLMEQPSVASKIIITDDESNIKKELQRLSLQAYDLRNKK